MFHFCVISSAGASSPTVPANVGSVDGSIHGQGSKGASISCVGSQPPMTSLSTSAAGGGGGGSSVLDHQDCHVDLGKEETYCVA